MLCGALLTVLRMVIRPSPEEPTLRTSSFDCFKAVWPANADCWIAEVAMTLFSSSSSSLLLPYLGCPSRIYDDQGRRTKVKWEMRRCCGLGNLHVASVLLVTRLDVDFHVDCFEENIGYSFAMWNWRILLIDASESKIQATCLVYIYIYLGG